MFANLLLTKQIFKDRRDTEVVGIRHSQQKHLFVSFRNRQVFYNTCIICPSLWDFCLGDFFILMGARKMAVSSAIARGGRPRLVIEWLVGGCCVQRELEVKSPAHYCRLIKNKNKTVQFCVCIIVLITSLSMCSLYFPSFSAVPNECSLL